MQARTRPLYTHSICDWNDVENDIKRLALRRLIQQEIRYETFSLVLISPLVQSFLSLFLPLILFLQPNLTTLSSFISSIHLPILFPALFCLLHFQGFPSLTSFDTRFAFFVPQCLFSSLLQILNFFFLRLLQSLSDLVSFRSFFFLLCFFIFVSSLSSFTLLWILPPQFLIPFSLHSSLCDFSFAFSPSSCILLFRRRPVLHFFLPFPRPVMNPRTSQPCAVGIYWQQTFPRLKLHHGQRQA